jgi:putative hemolysin
MRQRAQIPLAGIIMILLFLTAACDTTTPGAVATVATSSGSQAGTAVAGGVDSAQAADYCTSKGGQVVTRYPAYDANSNNPLRLYGSRQFCQFSAKDNTMIAIALDTLYTDQPTLAVLAYLTPPRVDVAPAGTNPASVYCTKLGGSDQFGGQNAAGGGWLLDDKNDTFYVLQTCIFPDLSAIDSWGLTYHADDTIRGTDLSKVVRYQKPNTSPPGIFGK